MNQHRLVRALLLACSSMAFAVYADAAVVQCLDDAGVTTFTDAPCKSEQSETRAPESRKNVPAKAKIALQATPFATAESARAAAWASKPTKAHGGMALDVTTLKAARTAMISSDRASALARQQTLAGL